MKGYFAPFHQGLDSSSLNQLQIFSHLVLAVPFGNLELHSTLSSLLQLALGACRPGSEYFLLQPPESHFQTIVAGLLSHKLAFRFLHGL